MGQGESSAYYVNKQIDFDTQAGKLALARSPIRVKICPGEWQKRPGWVEFCIGYIRDYPVRASATSLI